MSKQPNTARFAAALLERVGDDLRIARGIIATCHANARSYGARVRLEKLDWALKEHNL